MKKLLITILLLSTSLMALSDRQQEVRAIILDEAKKWTNYKSTIAGMALTESSLGLNILGDDWKSLGVMQIQLPTVRDYANRCKALRYLKNWSDTMIKTKLLTDIRFSVKVASLIFEFNRKKYGYFQAISRYNGGKNNHTYYNKVQKNKHWLMRQGGVYTCV